MTPGHTQSPEGSLTTRVCFLAPELLPNQGGVGTYCVELLRGMAGRVDLTVLTPERRKGATVYDRAAIEAYFDHRFAVETISVAEDTFLYNVAFQRAVRSYLNDRSRRDRFDIVHAQHAHMPDLLWDASRHGATTVRTIHSTIEGQREGIRIARNLGGGLQDSERWQIALSPVLQVAEWTVLQRPRDHYIAVSEWNRTQLLERGIAPDRIDTVHCGGDPVRYSPSRRAAGRQGVDPSSLMVLFPGRPTLVKGASVVAQALPEILRRVPHSRFVFTGGGADEFLSLVALPPELRSRVEFRGYVPYDTLPEIYAGADLVIAPTYYDSFPIRILEALASGVPVVASAVGGIPESVRPGITGRLVPSGDAAALTEAVVGLLLDAPLRRTMGQNGRRLIEERFSWQRAADSTLALYTRLATAG
jgi:glycosyltransferase involved in cell wall biosynthesis